MKSFSAQVSEWVTKAEGRIEAVFKDSAQELFSIAQTPVAKGGNMPVDTGNLRNSFVSSLNGQGGLTGAVSYELTIAGAKIGDTIFGGWTAAYARRIEYGFTGTDSLGRAFNQNGRGFVRHAAEQWQDIVDRNARRLRELSVG